MSYALSGILFEIDADTVRDYAREVNTQVERLAAAIKNPKTAPPITSDNLAVWTKWYSDWVVYVMAWRAHYESVLLVFGPAVFSTLEMWSRTEQYELELRALYDRFEALGGHPDFARPTPGPEHAPTGPMDALKWIVIGAIAIGGLYVASQYVSPRRAATA